MSVWRSRPTRINGLGATIADLATAMAAVESGSSPTALSIRNNNPGNLIYAGQAGAVPGAGGFAAFPSYAAGQQAEVNQIQLNLTRGTCVNGLPADTLTELISNCWAPPNAPGNTPAATQNYINSVAAATGIDPNADLASQLAGTATDNTGIALDAGSSAPVGDSGVDLSGIGLGVVDSNTFMLVGLAIVAGVVLYSRGSR